MCVPAINAAAFQQKRVAYRIDYEYLIVTEITRS